MLKMREASIPYNLNIITELELLVLSPTNSLDKQKGRGHKLFNIPTKVSIATGFRLR